MIDLAEELFVLEKLRGVGPSIREWSEKVARAEWKNKSEFVKQIWEKDALALFKQLNERGIRTPEDVKETERLLVLVESTIGHMATNLSVQVNLARQDERRLWLSKFEQAVRDYRNGTKPLMKVDFYDLVIEQMKDITCQHTEKNG